MKCIDVHGHIGKSGQWCFSPAEQSREAQLQAIDDILVEFGIEKCVVSSLLAISYDFREGNREVERTIEEEERLYGYVVVNPNYVDESVQEVEEYADHRKFVGIKNHPIYTGQRINSASNCSILEFVRTRKYNLPILLHTYDEADCRSVIEVAERFPEQKIIMGHMGGPQWRKTVDLLHDAGDTCDQIYLDPCCSHPDVDKIRYARDQLGVSRIVFGSDLDIISPAFTLGMVQSADLSDKDREKILYSNALAVFDFEE